jgi:transcriptional regulator with XRE-family HTH domain
MELGERIAAWRKAKGLTQREVAETVGVTPAAIYQWEDGTTKPGLSHLENFVQLLGITMERFYGRVPKAKAA